MEFSGRLAAFPVGDILQWVHHDRRSGALVVRRSGHEKRVYFRDGDVVSCLSDDPAEYLGQHLLLAGLIDEARLVKALTYCQQNGKRLGLALHELGLLGPSLILSSLRQQIQDLVCDVFLWRNGVFYFEAEMPPDEELLPEPLSAVGLAMEGSRWVDEYQRIRRVFVHDEIVLRSGLRWPGEQLTPLERRIVREVNGRKTLEEIYAAAKGSYFRFLQAALALAVREVLDIHDVHENVTPPSRELHLADLLVEQAAEEEVLFFRSHRALPLEVLENLCPIWVREPTPHQLALMPEKARAFYRHFDGQTPLGSVLAIDEKERSHQVELLLAQLRDGVLGLLPAPVEKLEEEAERTHEPVTRRWWRRFASGPQGA